VALGEVMLRLDPGDMRVKNARSFRVWEGGGEYNVARGLRRCFGQRTAILTAFADNEVGRLLEDLILQGGVDSSFIKWKSFDGVGRNCRNGLNFTERGFGVRGALGVSDRGNTAASQIRPEDFDFEDLFGKRGVRWFHTGGIFAALSDTTANTIIEALKIAKKYGTVVSYDLNYRPSLWKNFGGLEKAQEVNKKIAPYVDVMIGNEEDFSACLGFELEGADISLKKIDPAAYGSMIKKVAEAYPNFKLAANTLREVKTAGINDWSAICYYDGQIYEGIKFENLEIYDRIGGGDSFASGLIYGLLEGLSTGESLNYGIAHGALAMTSPGDTSMASLEEVRELLAGKTARVQR
ncbi:MAG TPA: sugar kinase, partial [Oscillospiraceae bacterium]|nr:sugar kinase [Oscillospiraceae bacterium]